MASDDEIPPNQGNPDKDAPLSPKKKKKQKKAPKPAAAAPAQDARAAAYDRARRQRLREIFDRLPPDQDRLGADDYAAALGHPAPPIFTRRLFELFSGKSGKVTREEFTRRILDIRSRKDKVALYFDVYDIKGNGKLEREEIAAVIDGMIIRSKLDIDAKATVQMSSVFFEAAKAESLKKAASSEERRAIRADDYVTKEGFTRHLLKSGTLSKDVSTLVDHWIGMLENEEEVIDLEKEAEKDALEVAASATASRDDSYFITMITLVLLIFGLMTYAAVDSKDAKGKLPTEVNYYIILANTFGFPLNVVTALVYLMMSKGMLNKLREWTAKSTTKWLPLNHHIGIHMFLGGVLFLFGTIHTAMHLINLSVNILPDPVIYLGLNGIQSEEAGYNAPEPGSSYSYSEWLFTGKPELFGRVHGWANMTGVLLMLTLVIMMVTSMGCVRRKGHFNLFYFSHLLYFPFYVLLIFHAPNFLYLAWIPIVYHGAKVFRFIDILRIEETYACVAMLLPSDTICLVVKKPLGFAFSTGDWVSVNAPDIARYEWHPFTISCSPEMPDVLTLHIKAMGCWTKKLQEKISHDWDVLSSHVLPRSLPEMRLLPHEYSTVARIVPYETPIVDLNEVVTGNNAKNNAHVERSYDQLILRLDGPYHAPATDVFQAEHAVLVATGIGVTPMASILHTILYRHRNSKINCDSCGNAVNKDIRNPMGKLKKVDFFWIIRDPREVSWFVDLLSGYQKESALDEFLDITIYTTRAVAKTDMCAVALRTAIQLFQQKNKGDLVHELKDDVAMGRPDLDKMFQALDANKKGEVSMFFCGRKRVASLLSRACKTHRFNFHHEVFN